tara:strand:+ start:5454 stop:5723 length:270 start_codon:yes stop_codon:yes gene_type:complete
MAYGTPPETPAYVFAHLVTPSMQSYTKQAIALSKAIEAFNFNNPRFMRANLIVFVNDFVENNAHEELGNWADIAKIVEQELNTRILGVL